MRGWLLAACLAAPGLAAGGTLLRADVTHDDGLYHLAVDARIEAPAEQVRVILLDYERLARINPSIKEVTVLWAGKSWRRRFIRSVVQACVLIFCKKAVQVHDMRVLPNGDIIATTIPQLSDFRYGVVRWRVLGESRGSQLQFTADLRPAFWVPPLIGPLLIKRTLRAEALKTIAALETLAVQPGHL